MTATTLIATTALGTERSPAPALRAAILSQTGAEQEASIAAYCAYLEAEMALWDGARTKVRPHEAAGLIHQHTLALDGAHAHLATLMPRAA